MIIKMYSFMETADENGKNRRYYVDGKRVSEWVYFFRERECTRFDCMWGETMKNGRRKFCKSGTVEK